MARRVDTRNRRNAGVGDAVAQARLAERLGPERMAMTALSRRLGAWERDPERAAAEGVEPLTEDERATLDNWRASRRASKLNRRDNG